MSVANSRMTIGSILAAVQTTANTVTSTLDAANQGIGMLNRYVATAAAKQKIREEEDLVIFELTYQEEKARELAESRRSIREFRNQSTDHQVMYDAAYEELAKLRAARKKA